MPHARAIVKECRRFPDLPVRQSGRENGVVGRAVDLRDLSVDEDLDRHIHRRRLDTRFVADGGRVRVEGETVTAPATPYFGFDIARDLELAANFYVLDGFGGVHAGGGAPVLNPTTPYFGFDIARDLELVAAGFYVLDGFGEVHAGGGASAISPATPYFGFDIAKDLEFG